MKPPKVKIHIKRAISQDTCWVFGPGNRQQWRHSLRSIP